MAKTITSYGDNCYSIPESLYPQYHGAGYAMIAIKNDELIAIKYLRDIDPDFDFDDDDLEGNGLTVHEHLKSLTQDQRIGNMGKLLNTLGNVHIGMMSCYQFIEL